jgi:hypothetical protein
MSNDTVSSLYACAPVGQKSVTNDEYKFTDSAEFETKARDILRVAMQSGDAPASMPPGVYVYAGPPSEPWSPPPTDWPYAPAHTGTTVTLLDPLTRIMALEARLADLEARISQLEKPKARPRKRRPARKK